LDKNTVTLPSLSADEKKIVDTVLAGFKVPNYDTVKSVVANAAIVAQSAKDLQTAMNKLVKDKASSEAELHGFISKLKEDYASKKYAEITITTDGVIPNGKVVMRPVNELFPGITEASFSVPYWEWDGVHPEVPSKDPHYIFREELLVRALFAISSNQRMYLQGHTGSGKTTLIEQIAAHLNWPFTRINFDSEITRMDLIGRDTLKDGESVFIDGMLPKMMTGPYIGVFDEIDFCRPDVAYVMQSVLEGNSFRITEDGGREIKPHPMFRMFATGNTVGQGDEHGMYQGARPQSLAFLDRFTVWGKVEYLKEDQRETLIKRHFPMLSQDAVKTLNKYSTEHLAAFESSKILQPISPRGILALARATVHMQTFFNGNINKAMKEAINMCILDRCTTSDYAVVKGIIDRVVK
jgi:cobaltochelatase CobS subunit